MRHSGRCRPAFSQAFARVAHDLWPFFIRDETPQMSAGFWPAYGASDARVFRLEAGNCRMAADPFGARPALWEKDDV